MEILDFLGGQKFFMILGLFNRRSRYQKETVASDSHDRTSGDSSSKKVIVDAEFEEIK